MGAIYLIHFSEPIAYKNRLFGDAQHYVGLTGDLRTRLMQHSRNRGSWVTKAAIAQGKELFIAGVFDDRDYTTDDESEFALVCDTFCVLCNKPYEGPLDPGPSYIVNKDTPNERPIPLGIPLGHFVTMLPKENTL